MSGLSLLTAGASGLMNARRIGTGIITRALRKEDEKLADKKHPKRARYIANIISQKKANVQRRFEKKFPTRKMRKEHRKKFKLQKKAEAERYKTDPVYQVNTVKRATTSEKYDMGASVLRYEAKHGSSRFTRTQSARILKYWLLPIYDGLDIRNWVKPLNPFGRKKIKKFKIEKAREELRLSGDV